MPILFLWSPWSGPLGNFLCRRSRYCWNLGLAAPGWGRYRLLGTGGILAINHLVAWRQSRLEQIGADWSRLKLHVNCMLICVAYNALLIMRCLYALLICCDSLTSFSMFLHVSPRRLDLNRPPCFGGCFCLRWIVTLYNLTHIVGSVDASVQQDLPLSLQVIYYVIVALWLSSLIRVLCTRPVCSTVVVLCFSKFYPKTLRIFSRHMHDIIIYIRVYYIHTNTHRHTHTHIQIIYILLLYNI